MASRCRRSDLRPRRLRAWTPRGSRRVPTGARICGFVRELYGPTSTAGARWFSPQGAGKRRNRRHNSMGEASVPMHMAQPSQKMAAWQRIVGVEVPDAHPAPLDVVRLLDGGVCHDMRVRAGATDERHQSRSDRRGAHGGGYFFGGRGRRCGQRSVGARAPPRRCPLSRWWWMSRQRLSASSTTSKPAFPPRPALPPERCA